MLTHDRGVRLSKLDDASPMEPTIVSCVVRRNRTIVLGLSDGRTLLIQPSISTRLARATLRQLSNFQSLGKGIHWPDVDEDLSVRGFLQQMARGEPSIRVGAKPRRSAAYAP